MSAWFLKENLCKLQVSKNFQFHRVDITFVLCLHDYKMIFQFWCDRVEKTSVLSDLIRRTNAPEMKWIIMIILKGVTFTFYCYSYFVGFNSYNHDLIVILCVCSRSWLNCFFCSICTLYIILCSDMKLGISERSIFHEFHPDAEDLFNVTCDLKLVCEKLRDRSQRHKRQVSFYYGLVPKYFYPCLASDMCSIYVLSMLWSLISFRLLVSVFLCQASSHVLHID